MPVEQNANKDSPSVEQRVTAIEAALNQTYHQTPATAAAKSATTEGYRKPSLAPLGTGFGSDCSQDKDTRVIAGKDGQATIDELAAKVAVLEFMSETDKLVILELSAHIVQLMEEKEEAERAVEDLLARLTVSEEEACSVLKK